MWNKISDLNFFLINFHSSTVSAASWTWILIALEEFITVINGTKFKCNFWYVLAQSSIPYVKPRHSTSYNQHSGWKSCRISNFSGRKSSWHQNSSRKLIGIQVNKAAVLNHFTMYISRIYVNSLRLSICKCQVKDQISNQ